jgi:hypothetical protein
VDVIRPGWDSENRLITNAVLLRSNVWRFSPRVAVEGRE